MSVLVLALLLATPAWAVPGLYSSLSMGAAAKRRKRRHRSVRSGASKRRLAKRRLAKRRLAKRRLAKRRLAKRRLAKRRLAKRRLVKRSPRRRYRRRRLIQLQDGPGFRVLAKRRAWGTHLTVAHIQRVMARYAAFAPGAAPVWIHDISKRWGGRMHPHVSHRAGRDVDVRLVHNRPTKRYRRATKRTLHAAHTWFLLRELIKTGDVEFIFLDRRLQRVVRKYARNHGVSSATLDAVFGPGGIVRHWKGHRDHMHVRFRPGALATPSDSMIAAK